MGRGFLGFLLLATEVSESDILVYNSATNPFYWIYNYTDHLVYVYYDSLRHSNVVKRVKNTTFHTNAISIVVRIRTHNARNI